LIVISHLKIIIAQKINKAYSALGIIKEILYIWTSLVLFCCINQWFDHIWNTQIQCGVHINEGSGWNAIPTVAMPRDASLAFNVGLTTSFCIITLSWLLASSSSEHGAPTDPTDEVEEDDIFSLNPGIRAQAGSYGLAERSRTLKSKL